MIVKYKLENRTAPGGAGLTAPECITDGGYFSGRDGTIIGYSDGAHPLGPTCVEITEAELTAHKTRLARTHEYAIRSDGKRRYTEPLDNDINSVIVSKTYPSNVINHLYKVGYGDCSFYSERTEGRKKYWKENIPAVGYRQPDSDSQILTLYSEISGVTQEWYYDFTTFDEMMAFVSRHKPISLKPSLEVKMRNKPLEVKPDAIQNPGCMYLASLEVTAAGDKITTIYLTALQDEII